MEQLTFWIYYRDGFKARICRIFGSDYPETGEIAKSFLDTQVRYISKTSWASNKT